MGKPCIHLSILEMLKKKKKLTLIWFYGYACPIEDCRRKLTGDHRELWLKRDQQNLWLPVSQWWWTFCRSLHIFFMSSLSPLPLLTTQQKFPGALASPTSIWSISVSRVLLWVLESSKPSTEVWRGEVLMGSLLWLLSPFSPIPPISSLSALSNVTL